MYDDTRCFRPDLLEALAVLKSDGLAICPKLQVVEFTGNFFDNDKLLYEGGIWVLLAPHHR